MFVGRLIRAVYSELADSAEVRFNSVQLGSIGRCPDRLRWEAMLRDGDVEFYDRREVFG